jgi:hypothetical protein
MILSPAHSSGILHLAAHSVFLKLENIDIQIMLYTPWANAVFQIY